MPPETDSEPAMTGTSEAGVNMERRGVRIVDTFAEAFDMRAARVVITANSLAWAKIGAQTMTGFATSVIGCKVEAGIEAELAPKDTPDGRPGVSVLLFGFDADGLSHRLLERIGQTILTCPTTACWPSCSARSRHPKGCGGRFWSRIRNASIDFRCCSKPKHGPQRRAEFP